MKTPAKRRTGEATASNVSTEQTWCTGDRRPATGESPYQIPTLDTTDWCTGDRRPASRRIRFQRSTQQMVYRRPATGESPYQIPTFNTTDWYTDELAYRRINSKRNNTADQYTGELAHRRPASVELIRTSSVADKMPQLDTTVNTRSKRFDRDSKLN